MRERVRARVAVVAIHFARWLLKIKPRDGDPWTAPCVYCGAPENDGEWDHALDCPSETGIFPVTLRDMWPAGPAHCEGCKTVLWPGARYSLIPMEPIGGMPGGMVACTGCSLLAQLEPRSPGETPNA